MDDAADRTLVEEARSGSREALNRLLAHCSPVVERYLQARVGGHLRRQASIADMRQDVLLRAVAALEHLPAGATVKDFEHILLRHASWAILKTARARKKASYVSDVLPGDTPRPDPAATLHTTGAVTREDQRAWLGARIDELDEPLAAVVRRRAEGATFAEIGRELGIGEDAARKRFLNASRSLRGRRG